MGGRGGGRVGWGERNDPLVRGSCDHKVKRGKKFLEKLLVLNI